MRSIAIASAGGSMLLDGSEGVRAKLAVRGTGMVPVRAQWFEGAGDGASYRGGRTLTRRFDLPVKVYADKHDPDNREVVRRRFARLAQILSLKVAPVRVTLDLAADSLPGDRWWADMVRVGGGDFSWESDTDGRSFVRTAFTLEAGDPYWMSGDRDLKVIEPAGPGVPMLAPGISLAQLRVGSTSGFGTTSIINTGDVEAYPTWTVEAPFTGFALTSQRGEALTWVGAEPKTWGWIEVNTQVKTVVDESGANRFGELGPAPLFWPVWPGSTEADVVLADASGSSRVTATWNVRREVLF